MPPGEPARVESLCYAPKSRLYRKISAFTCPAHMLFCFVMCCFFALFYVSAIFTIIAIFDDFFKLRTIFYIHLVAYQLVAPA